MKPCSSASVSEVEERMSAWSPKLAQDVVQDALLKTIADKRKHKKPSRKLKAEAKPGRESGKVMYGEVPPYSVVVSGTLPGKPLPDGSRPPAPASLAEFQRAARIKEVFFRSGARTPAFRRPASTRATSTSP